MAISAYSRFPSCLRGFFRVAAAGQVAAVALLCVAWLLSAMPALASAGWTQSNGQMTAARAGFGATTGPCPGSSGLATAKQCLYAIGGSNSTSTLAGVEYEDPSAAAPVWTPMTNGLNSARSELTATTAPCPGSSGLATAKQCLYAVGGRDSGGLHLSSVEYEDPSAATPSWTTMTNGLITPREYGAATTGPCPGSSGLATAQLCLYVIGGYNAAFAVVGSVEYEDPSAATPSWTTMTNGLTTARGDLAATTGPCPATSGLTTAKQCLYAIGGRDSSATHLGSVEVEDPSAATPSWTTMTHGLNLARGYLGAVTAPCPGSSGLSTAKQCLYAIGGWTVMSDVEYEDPSAATPSWTTMTNNLNTAREYLGATTAPCPDSSGLATAQLCLYALGGNDGSNNFLASVEFEDPSMTGPTISLLTHVHVARHASRLVVSWRLADRSGVVGFNIYAARHCVNRRFIPVHAPATYHVTLSGATRGHVTVRVYLRSGSYVSVSAR